MGAAKGTWREPFIVREGGVWNSTSFADVKVIVLSYSDGEVRYQKVHPDGTKGILTYVDDIDVFIQRYGKEQKVTATTVQRERTSNGARILAQHSTRQPGVYVVLCDTGEGDYERYVTWWMNEDGECSSGHYYQSIAKAAADYEERG